MLEARVLYFTGCPNHRPAVDRLGAVADRLGVPVNIREVEVTQDDEPKRLAFRGSPTVLIDGVDLDPAVRESDEFGFGCRMYGGGGTPPDAMIEAALKEAASPDAGEEQKDCRVSDPPGEKNSPRSEDSGSVVWASSAALGGAALASACCWLPLLAVGLGLSLPIGGLIGAFEAARPYMLGVAAVSLAVGFYLVYFRKARCAPGSSCATGRPRASAATQAGLWVAVVVVAALALFPHYSGALLSAASAPPGFAGGTDLAAVAGGPSALDEGTLVYRVEGMTCAGCEAAVRASLRDVPGVKAARASSEKGLAWITVGADRPAQAAVLKAIESAGFTGSPTMRNGGEKQPISAPGVELEGQPLLSLRPGAGLGTGLRLAAALQRHESVGGRLRQRGKHFAGG